MNYLVTGGTGMIGSPLCRELADQGHCVQVVTRHPGQRSADARITNVGWDAAALQAALEGCDGIINLAGESIAGGRWTPARKDTLRASRLETTRRLVDAIAAQPRRPGVLVSASAIGFYGPHGDEPLTESAGAGQGFLADLCQAWEAEARRAESLGVRVVCLRIGIVLAKGGGALEKMVPPFRWWLGGPLGSGRQWMSWVHRDDVVGLIAWSLARREVAGAVNATAPEPVTMRAFCGSLGRALRRPSWAQVPAPILRLALGELADVLLTGQRVLPANALAGGYTFHSPRLDPALQACLSVR